MKTERGLVIPERIRFALKDPGHDTLILSLPKSEILPLVKKLVDAHHLDKEIFLSGEVDGKIDPPQKKLDFEENELHPLKIESGEYVIARIRKYGIILPNDGKEYMTKGGIMGAIDLDKAGKYATYKEVINKINQYLENGFLEYT